VIPRKIILHHSLTKDSGTVSWGAIRRYHVTPEDDHSIFPDGGLGMRDIGYHAGVELVQSGPELYYEVLMGRPWDAPGGHTKGQNQTSLGICFIGDFDIREPPEGQLIAGARIVALWMRLFAIPIGEIYRHADFASKSCPGKMFDLPGFKKIVADEMRSSNS